MDGFHLNQHNLPLPLLLLHVPPSGTTALKPKVKDHYHSHRLSYWLSLIPKLHVSGPISATGVEHHLLTDHEDLNSYEGLVRESSPARIRSLMIESNPAFASSNNNNSSLLMISDLMKNNPHLHVLTSSHGNFSSSTMSKKNGAINNNNLNSDHPSSSSSGSSSPGIRDKNSGSSKSVSIELTGFNKKTESTFSDSSSSSSSSSSHKKKDHVDNLNSGVKQHNASSIFMMTQDMANYSTALSVTVAVGVSLLILNVLILAGIFYQRDRANRIQVCWYIMFIFYLCIHSLTTESCFILSTPVPICMNHSLKVIKACLMFNITFAVLIIHWKRMNMTCDVSTFLFFMLTWKGSWHQPSGEW